MKKVHLAVEILVKTLEMKHITTHIEEKKDIFMILEHSSAPNA